MPKCIHTLSSLLPTGLPKCSAHYIPSNDHVHSQFNNVLVHARLCLRYASADTCLRMKSAVVVIQTRNTAVLTALGAILFIHLHSIGRLPLLSPLVTTPFYSRMDYNFEDKDAINQPLLFHSMSTDDDDNIHATRKRSPSSRSKWFAVPAVEDQGIKPVSENERTHTRIIDNFTFWFSIASNVLTMALGVLGVHLFGLDFKSALGCIILANLTNSLPGVYVCVCQTNKLWSLIAAYGVGAFFITMGHRLGMRQIIITRYAYGYAGSRGVAVINILSSIGWSTLSSIQAGQLLVALMSSIPLAAAILIMSFITVTVAIFGYAVLHHFERWAWIPTWISILIMLATSATKLSTSTTPTTSSSNDIGAIISYATIIFSAPSIWSTSAADFTVKQVKHHHTAYIIISSTSTSHIIL